MKHSTLGASAAHRWLECPASVRMQEGEKDTAGFAAQEGTAAHALGEEALRAQLHPDTFIGDTFEGFVVDAEMAEQVGKYYDYVTDLFNSENHNLMIERRVEYTDWVPNGFGTADAIAIGNGVCHVIDLKYGKSPVYADNNPQGMLYALGCLQGFEWLHDMDLFVIHIIQPRIGNFSEWSIRKDDLIAFGEYARERAALTLLEHAPYAPSAKSCQWCKAQARCEALAEHNLEILCSDFDSIDLPEVGKLTNEEIAQIIPNAGLIKGWLDALATKALDEALVGAMPGYKAVAGRSTREWGDAEAAEKFLRQTRKLKVDQAYTKKLISPTQAEKILGKKDDRLNGLIVKPPGKPSLAPADDKRPALNNLDDFEAI